MEFTSAHGVKIKQEGYAIAWENSTGTTSQKLPYDFGSSVDGALAEWYEFRKDQTLDRWRDPENPNMVVYPDKNDHNAIVVLDETEPYTYWFHKEGEELSETARNYFDAHTPVPEPWHNPKAGDVWVLTVGGETLPYGTRFTVDSNDTPVEFVLPSGWTTTPTDPRITNGYKIWSA